MSKPRRSSQQATIHGEPPRPLALHVTRSGAADIILVADADWLYDSLCFNTTADQEGKTREVNISDNIAFLLNAAEVLADDSRLLRLRTRGLRKRTFTRIEALGIEAEREIQAIDTKAWQEGYAEGVQLQARIAPLATAEGGEDNPEIKRLVDEYEAHEAARIHQAKVAQRQVLHGLRLKLDGIERAVAAQVALLLPALLLLCAAVVGWRRRR